MKTRLLILLFLLLFSFIGVISSGSLRAADTDSDIPIISNSSTLPSSSYLATEKRSIASTVETATLSSSMRGFTTLSSASWNDPYLPGAEGEWSNPGNVGAPVGDATLPIIISILIFYMIYRSVTVSRRRNNF